MRRLLPAAAVVASLALVISEATMRPSAAERVALYGLFAGMSAAAAVAAWWLTRVHRRLPSLRWTILAVAVAAVAAASAVVAVAALAMFLSLHDLRLVIAALAFGIGLGVLVAAAVAGPLTTDLRRLAQAAGRVTDGDLAVRTGIARADEVGALARSIDAMVVQLDRAEEERRRGEAARRRLLAAVGHDLRTPLATLQASVEALQDGVADDPARYVRSMAREVTLMRGMVEDLFVLARLESGELRLDPMEIDLMEVADGAVEAMAAVAARRRVDVRLDATESAVVAADPQALARVLRNLLDNAIRHAPPETTVRVTWEASEEHGTVRVQDEGPGFPDAFRGRAFDPFSRAHSARDRSSGGAGLGLAIARGLVSAHGGGIWIEPGPGGRVAFTVPLADRFRARRRSAAPARPEPQGPGRRGEGHAVGP